MMRVFFSSLFLAVCFGSVLSSSDVHHTRRTVRDTDSHKTFGEYGNYVSTVIFIDIPSFSNFTDVNDIEDSTDKFSIHYSDVKFYKLSSAYALSYGIDLDANTVQFLLSLGKAQIKGLYSISVPSSVNSTVEEFELNLYAHLLYSHYTHFVVDNGKVILGKTDTPRLLHKKVRGKYNNAPSALADDLKNYLNPKLLAAVVAKIYDEVSLKVSQDEIDSQIKSEIAFRYRSELADRLKKAVIDAFADVPINAFNVFYHDTTNFKRIIRNLEVTVPTYILRDVQGFHLNSIVTSYVGADVIGKAKFLIQSPLVVFEVVYRELNKAGAESKSFHAEFQLSNDVYEFEMIAKPDSSTVEFGTLDINVGAIQVSPTQGLYGDERDIIVHQLRGHLFSYFLENSYYSFSRYCLGLLAEGRIAHHVFK